MTKIAHAVANYDNIDGDSSGKEILVTKWYKRTGGWTYILTCKDSDMASKAAKYAELIANNDSYGYSKESGSGGRWSGYNSIKSLRANGYPVEEAIAKGKGNFDCSSFCITCYILAGLKHKSTGYSGSIPTTFVETGKFDISESEDCVKTDEYATIGALYVSPKAHVAMSLENGSKSSKKDDSFAGNPYVKIIGSVRLRKEPKTGKTVDILKNGDTATIVDTDPGTGWYYVRTSKSKYGYVTNNEKYVTYVEQVL